MKTDTEMLEWLVRNRHCGVTGSDAKGWVAHDAGNGLAFISGMHPTFRDALTEAMERKP